MKKADGQKLDVICAKIMWGYDNHWCEVSGEGLAPWQLGSARGVMLSTVEGKAESPPPHEHGMMHHVALSLTNC